MDNLSQNQVLEIVLIGIVAIAGLIWQSFTLQKDRNRNHMPIRVIVPLVVAAVFIIGTVIWGIITVSDEQKQVSIENIETLLIGEIVLFVSFIIKAWLGPVFTAIAACMLIYYGIEYGEVRVFPFVLAFFDWVFDKLPMWVEIPYYIVLACTTVLGSFIDSLSPDLHI